MLCSESQQDFSSLSVSKYLQPHNQNRESAIPTLSQLENKDNTLLELAAGRCPLFIFFLFFLKNTVIPQCEQKCEWKLQVCVSCYANVDPLIMHNIDASLLSRIPANG